MNVKNCKSCGRLFNYISGAPICDGCKSDLEKKFHEVKEFVRTHGDAPINVVSETCEVSVRQIKQWVREERLMLSEGVGFFLECESCGAAIRTGRFCAKCKGKIKDDLSSVYAKPITESVKKPKGSDKDRMRFLDS